MQDKVVAYNEQVINELRRLQKPKPCKYYVPSENSNVDDSDGKEVSGASDSVAEGEHEVENHDFVEEEVIECEEYDEGEVNTGKVKAKMSIVIAYYSVVN